MKKFLTLIIIAFAFCSISNCGISYKDSIIGRWKMVNKNIIFEYRKDGACTQGTKKGTYKIRYNKLYAEVNGKQGVIEIVLIMDDEMTLKLAGKEFKFKKIK